jgi:hypothetical protein
MAAAMSQLTEAGARPCTAASVYWFEIPADDPERTNKFDDLPVNSVAGGSKSWEEADDHRPHP